MNICLVCKAIPFDALPSEEEPALPHLNSLKDLEASAKTCSLCLLLLKAAGEICMTIKNKRDGHLEADRGGWVVHSKGLIAGKEISFIGYEGLYVAGGNTVAGTISYNKDPLYLSPQEMFPEGDEKVNNIRPWVFGNWWTSGTPAKPLQLMGMGIRLGKTAQIEDAEGNSLKAAHLRGTNLRFRTDNSEFKYSVRNENLL